MRQIWPRLFLYVRIFMMTSSNGNIFRVTGPLCGEFTGPGEFPAQRPVTRSFDVFFDLRPNKRLSKQPWGWWFETPSWSLWRQCNVYLNSATGDVWQVTGLSIVLTITLWEAIKAHWYQVIIELNVTLFKQWNHLSNFEFTWKMPLQRDWLITMLNGVDTISAISFRTFDDRWS